MKTAHEASNTVKRTRCKEEDKLRRQNIKTKMGLVFDTLRRSLLSWMVGICVYGGK